MSAIDETELIRQYLVLCNEQQDMLRNHYTSVRMIHRNVSEIILQYLRNRTSDNSTTQNSTTQNSTTQNSTTQNSRPVISHTRPSLFPSSVRQRIPIFALPRPPPIRPPTTREQTTSPIPPPPTFQPHTPPGSPPSNSTVEDIEVEPFPSVSTTPPNRLNTTSYRYSSGVVRRRYPNQRLRDRAFQLNSPPGLNRRRRTQGFSQRANNAASEANNAATNTVLWNPRELSPVRIRPNIFQIRQATELKLFSEVQSSQTHCPLDLQEFQPEDFILRIKHCGHIFKEMLLKRHFRSSARCPLCRFDIRDHIDISRNIIDGIVTRINATFDQIEQIDLSSNIVPTFTTRDDAQDAASIDLETTVRRRPNNMTS